ncbi:ribosome small subunit-dependent GTPase A [Leptospira sarikeiensis]|uniref:Small ribosomal subunit biogenesis GTPase RsgA n=1 Tax=Leptospira sarikeiensis TaxID=2484943 RepID=A0A4R9K9M0_9LEPT|nr:ribosome small subunit-dependent GTPase A [Leptospira sarikeiensis]TGL63367.1 ribosome small subunit-dependent GTPase A [Leptospira sarikeiensis]
MNQDRSFYLSVWDGDREKEFNQISIESGISDPIWARVIGEQGQEFRLSIKGSNEEGTGILTGSLRFNASSALEFPVAGDWVLATKLGEEEFLIHSVLPRRSLLVRKFKGETQKPDPICANMDRIFLLHGLDGDFQPRRLERTLVQIWESKATPVIVLTKKDLYSENEEELQNKIQLVRESCPGVEVFCISNHNLEGLQELDGYWKDESTSAFIGSSGVGKSSLLNLLIGEEIRSVKEVRESDSKGKHTTTNRWMFRIRSGAWILDTPGMREIQLWSDGSGLEETFPEIFEASINCRFQDCSHISEPDCGVKEAIASGKISEGRWASFLKLKRELERNANLAAPNSLEFRNQKAKWKSIHKEQKRMQQQRDRERYR